MEWWSRSKNKWSGRWRFTPGKVIEELKWEDSQKLRERELEYQWTLFKTWLKFQNELYAAKFQDHQGGIAETSGVNSATGFEAKLPKLVIIKFNGTFQDWPRFWGQYSKATDKLSFASKFSYLRELLAPKVRTSIEALRFHLRVTIALKAYWWINMARNQK